MTRALATQAKTAFSFQEFLQQTRRESYVSHFSGSLHLSVRHALLLTPSSSALFGKDVILASLTQVKDDSPVSLLKNISSPKGGGKIASTSSSSGYCCRDSSSPSSSSPGCGSRSFRCYKRPTSSSLSRYSTVAFKGILRFLLQKRVFRSRSHVPCLSG